MSATVNPRYIAYAAAHGETPDSMLERDRERWPGGVMAGFMLWIEKRWQEWHTANGRKIGDLVTEKDQESFDRMIGAL